MATREHTSAATSAGAAEIDAALQAMETRIETMTNTAHVVYAALKNQDSDLDSAAADILSDCTDDAELLRLIGSVRGSLGLAANLEAQS